MRCCFLLFAWAFALAGSPFLARAQEVRAMTASSLTDSMKDLKPAWAAHDHPAPRFVFAVPSGLARQAGYGVPTGIVMSADEPQVLLASLTRPEAAPTHCELGHSIRQ